MANRRGTRKRGDRRDVAPNVRVERRVMVEAHRCQTAHGGRPTYADLTARDVEVELTQDEAADGTRVPSVSVTFSGSAFDRSDAITEPFQVRSSETLRAMSETLLALAEHAEKIGLFDAARVEAALEEVMTPAPAAAVARQPEDSP